MSSPIKRKKVRVTVLLDPDVYNKLKALTGYTRGGVSSLVNYLLRVMLERQYILVNHGTLFEILSRYETQQQPPQPTIQPPIQQPPVQAMVQPPPIPPPTSENELLKAVCTINANVEITPGDLNSLLVPAKTIERVLSELGSVDRYIRLLEANQVMVKYEDGWYLFNPKKYFKLIEQCPN